MQSVLKIEEAPFMILKKKNSQSNDRKPTIVCQQKRIVFNQLTEVEFPVARRAISGRLEPRVPTLMASAAMSTQSDFMTRSPFVPRIASISGTAGSSTKTSPFSIFTGNVRILRSPPISLPSSRANCFLWSGQAAVSK